MNDAQYGILSGTVFTITNSVSGILMGYQVDRFNRKYLLLFSSFVWNLILATTYFADSYGGMIAIRMSFAVISSVHTPACISLINDLYSHEDRGKANSVYVTAISFGVGMANLTSLINTRFGWRVSAIIVSSIGLFFSILILCIKEPIRQSDRGTQYLLEKQSKSPLVQAKVSDFIRETMNRSSQIRRANSLYSHRMITDE